MAAAEISVVVPAYNEEALIQSTLDGLRSYLFAGPNRLKSLSWTMAVRTGPLP